MFDAMKRASNMGNPELAVRYFISGTWFSVG